MENQNDDIVSSQMDLIERKKREGEALLSAATNSNIKFLELARKRGWNITEE